MAVKKVLVMAGGTGGHIFPALATARVLMDKGFHVEWLGNQDGMEAKLVPEQGIAINFIRISGLRGKGFKKILMMPLKIITAVVQTRQVFNDVKPDVVLGMGGYVAGPGGFVAWLMRKPLVIHEQNAIAGLTNRILSRLTKNIYAAFPGAFGNNKKVHVCGNPVRESIVAIAEPEQRYETTDTLNLLVVGGSLGAKALNIMIPHLLSEKYKANKAGFFKHFKAVKVIHQCGEKNYESTATEYKKAGVMLEENSDVNGVSLRPFVKEMDTAYSWAHLVICRAGALTISELAAAGVASLLVPYPYAVDDHQTANSKWLVENKAALMIQERDMTIDAMINLVERLDIKTLKSMAVAARRIAVVNAADILAEKCVALAN